LDHGLDWTFPPVFPGGNIVRTWTAVKLPLILTMP
jgi:hypothetical protein